MEIPVQSLTPFLSLFTVIVGAAVTWGMFRASLTALTKEVERLGNNVNEHVKAVGSISNALVALETEVRMRFDSGPYKMPTRRRSNGSKRGKTDA